MWRIEGGGTGQLDLNSLKHRNNNKGKCGNYSYGTRCIC